MTGGGFSVLCLNIERSDRTDVWVDVFDRSLIDQHLCGRRVSHLHRQRPFLVLPAVQSVAGALEAQLVKGKVHHPDAYDGLQIVSETGDTFKDVPMMMSRSTWCLSSINERSNTSSNFSPKNVMSGWSHGRSPISFSPPRSRSRTTEIVLLAFMIPGGYAGGSGSSEASLSQPSLRFLPFFPALAGTAGGCTVLQYLQRGTL